MKKQFLIPLLIVGLLIIVTIAVVVYGKGYRFDLDRGRPQLSGTGLLVATSNPNGAQVFINSNLTTATDNTINLSPGTYTVKIFKDGYFPWEKNIKIQKEVVAKAEALLLPKAPKLENITASGVKNPSLDPSQTRIAYTVSSQSVRKNGVYVLDMSNRPILTLQSASVQIADDTTDLFSSSLLSWSPDGTLIVATISGNLNRSVTYILKANGFNEFPQNVTATLPSFKNDWQNEQEEKEKSRIQALKPPLQKMISQNFRIIAWSPDETKILYEATASATLPLIIKPRLIGFDSTPEQRSIETGAIYVYDMREDKNYKIEVRSEKLEVGSSQGQLPLSWFPDSKHLVYVNDKKINIMEYDGTNSTTVYAGPFVDNYVFSWPNGSKMVILTNLNNTNIEPNLYTIGLK